MIKLSKYLIILALAVTSCSALRTKRKAVFSWGQQLEELANGPWEKVIHPGEASRIQIPLGAKVKVTDFNCRDKSLPWVIEAGLFTAFVAESYFSDLSSFSCKLEVKKEDKGASNNFVIQIDYAVQSRKYKSETLLVDSGKVHYGAKEAKRIEAEQKILTEIYQESSPMPYFHEGFGYPMEAARTSEYGTQRIFNDVKKSQHLGIDFKAKEGTPIMATNSGKVVLARELFFTGDTIIIDHGLGVFSMYGHLSKIHVHEGQLLTKASLIGLSGVSGRVTGPHLHFGVKIHGFWIDGDTLIQETFANEKL